MTGSSLPKYSIFAAWLLLGSLAAHAAQLLFGLPVVILFLLNLAILVGLTMMAIAHHRAHTPGFDGSVGAETVVAFGVLSLILGLSTAIIPVVANEGNLAFDAQTLERLAMPFLQGLATAGIAPVIAVILRNYTAELDGYADAAGELANLARSAATLRAELDGATTAAGHLHKSLAVSASETGKHGAALGSGMATVAKAVATSGGALASELDSSRSKLVSAIEQSRKAIEHLASASAAGSREVDQLSQEVGNLKNAATDSTALLQALGQLIDSVERFVKPLTPAR